LKVPAQPYVARCVGSERYEYWIYTWAATKAEAISEWNRLFTHFHGPSEPDGDLEIYGEPLFDSYCKDWYVPANILLRANWTVGCGYYGKDTNKETGAEVKHWAICKRCLPTVLLANEYGPTWDDIFACYMWDYLGPFPDVDPDRQ
jgi:hypothetical protein